MVLNGNLTQDCILNSHTLDVTDNKRTPHPGDSFCSLRPIVPFEDASPILTDFLGVLLEKGIRNLDFCNVKSEGI